MESQYDIFISYRRETGKHVARTIQQALEKHYRVFLDFDVLKDGVFDKRIMDAISHSPVFLLLLTKGALNRCVNEEDWVRQEIFHAVKCQRHIVPVDMSGNVWEWTATPVHSYASDEKPGGTVFLRRGGSWWHEAKNCRVSRRYASDHSKKTSGLGLRVVIRESVVEQL